MSSPADPQLPLPYQTPALPALPTRQAPAWAGGLASGLAVRAVGWATLLLLAMVVVNTVVAGLMARLRHQARQALRHQRQAEQLRHLGDALRDSAEPLAHAGTLQNILASLLQAPVALLLCREQPSTADADPRTDPGVSVMALGQPDADETAGLWHCLRQGQAMGPGSGHHETLAHWYLPLRGRQASFWRGGAAPAGRWPRR